MFLRFQKLPCWFLVFCLVGCLPWRSQKEEQVPLAKDLRDWEDFVPLDPKVSFASLKTALLRSGPDFEVFMSPGPIPYKVHENRLAKWRDGSQVVYDSVVPQSASRTPVVVIVHGNHSYKEAHRYQAERLASFGIHALVLQVPNQDQWILNGELVRRFIVRLRENHQAFGPHIDVNNIILAGHSFGGSAVTIAAGRNAPIRGMLLLDPAVVSDSVLHYMRRVKRPTFLLRSDPEVFRARRQEEFSQQLGGEFMAVGVAGSTHDDAQFPSMFSHAAFGYDPFTSSDKQEIFAAALTLGAFSLGATGRLTYASEALTPMIVDGDLIDEEKRPPLKIEAKSPKR